MTQRAGRLAGIVFPPARRAIRCHPLLFRAIGGVFAAPDPGPPRGTEVQSL